jgi:hypothetical protein
MRDIMLQKIGLWKPKLVKKNKLMVMSPYAANRKPVNIY